MKHYILWVSKKGSKEIVAIYQSIKEARETRDEMMKWCPKYQQRAYITEAKDGVIYTHEKTE